jgi:uncharacterized protein YpmS|tara:strand:- start:520 stop:744 length:225 start_codon:yes stop_codon:yes gene_type:complete
MEEITSINLCKVFFFTYIALCSFALLAFIFVTTEDEPEEMQSFSESLRENKILRQYLSETDQVAEYIIWREKRR